MKLLKHLLTLKTNKSSNVSTNRTLDKGNFYETQAELYLISAGLVLREKNFRCKSGEIDLIMLDGDTIVFVEVRYRKKKQFGSALESIDLRKRKKIAKAASLYLSIHQLHNDFPCRFDVVAFEDKDLKWIKNAFELSEL